MTNAIVKRKPWIDALRALAIVFVVMGHQVPWWDSFFVFTTPIKIPLFFAISGYLFNTKDDNNKAFFLGVFRKLLFPFFCLVTIPALCYSLVSGIHTLFTSWYDMLSGESYWFMTCLIIAESIHFFIRKYFKQIWMVGLTCLVCAILGFVLSSCGLLNFASINTALICQAYLFLGYILKCQETALDRVNITYIILLFILYLCLCFSSKYFFSNTDFDCHLNRYYNIPYCWLLITLGCSALFMLAKRIQYFPRWLSYVGQNTLILYLWAGHAMLLFVALSKAGVVLPEESVVWGMIQTFWACLVCMIAAKIINSYFPFILGKR